MKKRRIEIAVISDVHLGASQCHAEELLAYLSSIWPKKLILNGDIIDRSRTARAHFPQVHFKVLKKIVSMAAAGIEVYYLCGDHEPMLRKFRGFNLNNFYIKNKLLLELDGKKVFFFHGDVFDALPLAGAWITHFGNAGFGFLLAVNSMVNWFRSKLGKPVTSPLGRLREHPARSARVVHRFEKTTADIAIRNGYDGVVCGHLHKPAKHWVETPSGKTLYLNSGDWVENLTALEYNFKRWKLYRYDEDKLSPFFADEDLKGLDINDLIESIVAKKEDPATRKQEKSSGE